MSASCIASSARETIRGISLTNFFFASAFCPLVTDLAQVRQGAAMKSTSPNATSICGRIQSSVRPGFNPRRMGRPLFFTHFSDLSPTSLYQLRTWPERLSGATAYRRTGLKNLHPPRPTLYVVARSFSLVVCSRDFFSFLYRETCLTVRLPTIQIRNAIERRVAN